MNVAAPFLCPYSIKSSRDDGERGVLAVTAFKIAGREMPLHQESAAPGRSRATRRKVGCGVHAATGWLHELPITQFNLTGCPVRPKCHGSDLLATGRGRIRPDPDPAAAKRRARRKQSECCDERHFASILGLTFETLKALISGASISVPKLTLCGTTNASFREGRPAQVGHQPYRTSPRRHRRSL